MPETPNHLPERKPMRHKPPYSVDASSAYYFITVCAEDRSSAPFLSHASTILDSARFRHISGLWFLSLFLVMPDHIHMLVKIPEGKTLNAIIGNWKHYLSARLGIAFQKNYFDTRIRDDAHYAEKWNYVVRNPVARGLVETPRAWPHVIAFDRETGAERPHR